mmetsp:Transcript_24272/g.55221  ORF Transcript_24272/g.55221 Transcript_24272/m.55221 type:complete len:215 (+) Transcript_24272:1471-2115(+)
MGCAAVRGTSDRCHGERGRFRGRTGGWGKRGSFLTLAAIRFRCCLLEMGACPCIRATSVVAARSRPPSAVASLLRSPLLPGKVKQRDHPYRIPEIPPSSSNPCQPHPTPFSPYPNPCLPHIWPHTGGVEDTSNSFYQTMRWRVLSCDWSVRDIGGGGGRYLPQCVAVGPGSTCTIYCPSKQRTRPDAMVNPVAVQIILDLVVSILLPFSSERLD